LQKTDIWLVINFLKQHNEKRNKKKDHHKEQNIVMFSFTGFSGSGELFTKVGNKKPVRKGELGK
jgi:hypothetical protein